jgi:hypothetical protein
MEAILFVVLVAAVAAAGIGLGLALAPRLTRWDDRRSRTEEDHPADGGGRDEDD